MGLAEIYKMAKCQSCWVAAATQELETNGEDWICCNQWQHLLQWISRMKGWSSHLRSNPPNMWSKSPLQIHSEITQSREGTAMLVNINGWHDANDLKYAPGSPSLTSQRNRSSLLWQMSQGNGIWCPPLQHPSNTTLYSSRNNAVTERRSFGLEPRDMENEEKSFKNYSRRRRNPKQEFPDNSF